MPFLKQTVIVSLAAGNIYYDLTLYSILSRSLNEGVNLFCVKEGIEENFSIMQKWSFLKVLQKDFNELHPHSFAELEAALIIPN